MTIQEGQEVYKLMRLRRDGSLGSLFINAKAIIPVGQWLQAFSYPTTGFAVRPGWHVTRQPIAPHLSMKGRVWVRAMVRGISEFKRPECQGGVWLLAEWMEVREILSPATVAEIVQGVHAVKLSPAVLLRFQQQQQNQEQKELSL